jgi:hypothetical protein
VKDLKDLGADLGKNERRNEMALDIFGGGCDERSGRE